MRSPTSNTTVFFIIFLLVSPLKPIVAETGDGNKEDLSFLEQVCSKLGLNEDQCFKLGKASSFAAYAAAAAAAGAVGVPAVLASMGFAGTGITAGSWAAWYQSTYGIGTAFSWLQSVSMTGWAAGAATKLGVMAAGAKTYFFGDDCKQKSTDDERFQRKTDEQ